MKYITWLAFIGIVSVLVYGAIQSQERSECIRWASENYTINNVAQWQIEQCNNYKIKILK